MAKRRAWSDGSVVERSPGVFRLRYWVNGKRHSTTFRGTKSAASQELRRLLTAGDKGEHVDPTRRTVQAWIEHWLSIGAPGKRQRMPSGRTVERYSQLLRTHVLPTLGPVRLQKLTAGQIDSLYVELSSVIAPRTCHHVHIVLGAALGAAARSGELSVSPMGRLLKVPSPGEADHGVALGEDDLRRLVDAFRSSVLYPIVAVAASTGMRRNEILALRWSDVDTAGKTIKVERALEQTKAGGITFKPPKTKRGKRSVAIDDGLLTLLAAERDKHLRIVAGVPDGARVNLAMIRLPADALVFPSPEPPIDLAQPRDPHAITRGFTNRVQTLGFGRVRFHDLRGSHGTNLLRRGVPPDVVARRLGHDPATMWRSYIKALPGDDAATLSAVAAMAIGGLGSV